MPASGPRLPKADGVNVSGALRTYKRSCTAPPLTNRRGKPRLPDAGFKVCTDLLIQKNTVYRPVPSIFGAGAFWGITVDKTVSLR